MNAVHESQSGSHKTGLKFSISIGIYSINSIFKVRATKDEMRRVTMRFFKARKDFDYRGMRNKLKKPYVHVHWIEDVWADCRSDHDVRRLDYCLLTVEQIENFGLADVPDDLEEDSDILDPLYKNNRVYSTPLPLIQWSQKEQISIKVCFQSILTNTDIWLSLHGVPLKPFSSGCDDDTIGPMGKRFEIRNKNKQDVVTPTKIPKLKFIVGSKKGKSQGEP